MSESIVEWKPRPRDRVYFRLSGGRFFTVPQSEVGSLTAGSTVTTEEIERLSRVDQYFRGREKALRLLSIRPRTHHEIKKALDSIQLEAAVRDGVMLELKERGLIDDERFAREYVQAKMDLKQLGPHRLRFELKRLGISAELTAKTLDAEVDDGDQERMARDLVRRKLGTRKPDEGDVRRLTGLLQRKGLDFEVINRVMYDVFKHGSREARD